MKCPTCGNDVKTLMLGGRQYFSTHDKSHGSMCGKSGVDVTATRSFANVTVKEVKRHLEPAPKVRFPMNRFPTR